MDYLLEFYDDNGRKFHAIRCQDAIAALLELATACETWHGLGFRNASCYYRGSQVWNIEITG